MKISLNWLARYTDLDGLSTEQITEALPMLGHEVESIETWGLTPNERLVVGEVLSRQQHPDADRLGVCMVDTGSGEPLQIVCGATNYKVGDRVPVALVGCTLPGDFTIKRSKLRGVESNGMMCSAKELGLGSDHAGLLILQGKPPVGTPVSELFDAPDTILELELTANRGDCLSHIGVARELAARFNRSLKLPEVTEPAPVGENRLQSITVTSPNCPLYHAWSIVDVTVGPSPKWLRNALESVGLRSINNVVDITNFVLLETGQPLHAFDASKIEGGELIIRDATEGETITTLDNVERRLCETDLVIADAVKPLVIAGVMGSVAAEVDENTTSVVLESAWFNPDAVRRTTRRLNLFSDSSHRFTRDVDPTGALRWGERAAALIIDVAGGRMGGPCLTFGEPPRTDRTIPFNLEYLEKRIGFEVGHASVQSCFEALGFTTTSTGDGKWEVSVPAFRSEVDRPIDLVEEFIRMHGTDRIPGRPVRTIGLHRNHAAVSRFTSRAIDLLNAQGFFECVNYSLTDAGTIKAWDRAEFEASLRLENPLTAEMSHVRPSLIPGLVGNLARNRHRGNAVTRLCETGRVFRFVKGAIHELVAVSFVWTVEPADQTWLKREAPDFHAAKVLTCDIARLSGLPAAADPALKPEDLTPAWQPGHAACSGCYAEDGFMASVGLLNIDRLKACDVDGFVLAGEIMCLPQALENVVRGPVRFRSFSEHPASERDLALTVDASTPAEMVRSRVADAATDACAGTDFECESVKIFDVYQDAALAESGKKSIALSFSFRSGQRTLKDKEVNRAFDAVQAAIPKLGYAIRS